MPAHESTPEERVADARRRATLKMQHRRRRTVAGLVVLLVFVLLIASAFALGGGSKPKPTTVVRRTTPTTPLGQQMLAKESAAVSKTLERMPLVGVAGKDKRDIALTFDDGPGPYTIGVAKVLKRYGVPATFFQVGFTEHYWTDAESLLASSHSFVLGNHTWNHPDLTAIAQKDGNIVTELTRTAALLPSPGNGMPFFFARLMARGRRRFAENWMMIRS